MTAISGHHLALDLELSPVLHKHRPTRAPSTASKTAAKEVNGICRIWTYASSLLRICYSFESCKISWRLTTRPRRLSWLWRWWGEDCGEGSVRFIGLCYGRVADYCLDGLRAPVNTGTAVSPIQSRPSFGRINRTAKARRDWTDDHKLRYLYR